MYMLFNYLLWKWILYKPTNIIFYDKYYYKNYLIYDKYYYKNYLKYDKYYYKNYLKYQYYYKYKNYHIYQIL